MAREITSSVVIRINDKQVVNSFNGIRSEVTRLERELKKLTPGTEEFRRKAAEVKEARRHFENVKQEIDAVNGKLKQSEGFFGKFRSTLSDFGLGIGHLFAGGLVAGISQTATELLKISDAMADVQKTTGMALEEVKGLWDAFDEMDTRTSKLDRLKIAEVGGRLGVPKEEMASFVQEVDKAYVALGDSFQGGLEAVVDSLGKIKGLFSETKGQSYAQAINEIGSALNELAASGTASEGNISDFALRVGALPDALKPSIEKVLGLGAAFEESGVDSQVAASGFSNFVKVAGENLEKFAYSMGMSYAEAQKLFNEKPEEFFLRFAQGMRDVPAEETALIFDSLKIGTLEVQKAVGAAANRTDEFRAAMQRAGVAMDEATSLNDEFAKKNNNAAAIWEKIKNVISDTFTKTTVINWFEGVIHIIGWFTGVTKEAGNGVLVFKERLAALGRLALVVITSIVSYNLALTVLALTTKNVAQQTIIYTAIQKAKVAIETIARGATLLYSAAKLRLAGDTARATVAMRAFNIATRANPVGLLVSVLITAGTALYTFYGNTEKATDATKKMREEFKNAGKMAGEEIAQLKLLYQAATDHKRSIDERKEAVKQLKEQYPSYFQHISDEIIMNGKAEASYNSLKKAIIASAKAKAAKKILEDREAERIGRDEDLQKKIYEEMVIRNNLRTKVKKDPNGKYIRSVSMGQFGGYQNTERTYQEDLESSEYRLNNLYNQIKTNIKTDAQKDRFITNIIEKNERIAKPLENDRNKHLDPVSTNIAVPDGKGGKGGTTNRLPKSDKDKEIEKEIEKSKDLWEKSKENKAKYDKELLEAHRKYEDDKIALMQDGFAKEKELEKTKHKRELEDLDSQNEEKKSLISQLNKEIEDLENKIKNKKTPQSAKENYQKTIDAKKEEIAQINAIIEQNGKIETQMIQAHNNRIRAIEEKEALATLEKKITNLHKEAEETARIREEEIQNISTMKEAKQKLSEMEYLTLSDQELKSIETLEDAKKALRENANREALQAQLKLLEEEQALLNEALSKITGEEAENLKKNLDELKNKITGIKGAIQNGEENDAKKVAEDKKSAKEKVDILGYSAQDWEDMWDNLGTTEGKIAAIGMVAKSLGNAFSMFEELQRNLNEREMRNFTKNQDKKKKALLQQLNEGYINQEEYHKGLELLEKERLNKESEMKYKEAKMQKVTRIADAVSATALGIANSLKVGGPAGIALASIVGALGAIQIGVIASQPLPERETFAQGGYTGSGSGKPDRTGFRPAGIVHEDEYVTPKWMLQNPVVADVVGWMESIRTGNCITKRLCRRWLGRKSVAIPKW